YYGSLGFTVPPALTIYNSRFTILRLLLCFHSVPEGDVVLDLVGSGFRFGIIPGSVLICFAIDHHVVIARSAFPGTDGMRTALLKKLSVDSFGRKIMIPLNDNGFVALSENGAVP